MAGAAVTGAAVTNLAVDDGTAEVELEWLAFGAGDVSPTRLARVCPPHRHQAGRERRHRYHPEKDDRAEQDQTDKLLGDHELLIPPSDKER